MGTAFTEIAASLSDALAHAKGGDTGGVEHRPDVIDVQATGAAWLVNHLPKPGPDRRTVLRLAPLELIDRFAALIPPPRETW